jgi:hypothetical protein
MVTSLATEFQAGLDALADDAGVVTRLPEGFSHFVASIAAPVASGWSDLAGGICTHWKAPPCHGAP